jgi:mRNA interferase HigB
MHFAGRPLLNAFADTHADIRGPLAAWIDDVERGRWKTPHELKARFPSVSFLGDGVAVFNIKGNTYRLDCLVDYERGVMVARWIGTHAEYSKRT